MTVRINGRPALANGVLLVPHGTAASFQLGSDTVSLIFDPAEAGYRWDRWRLTLPGGEFPLGYSVHVPLGAPGAPVTLAVAVHTLGAMGGTMDRIVNYILYAG